MKKFNPNKNITITSVTVIIVVTILSVTAAQRAGGGKPNFFRSVVNDSVAVADKTIFVPIRWMRDGVDSIHSLFSTYAENERLREKIDSYDDVAQQNKNYEREIEFLKRELDLNQTLASYGKVTTNVITRSPDSQQGTLIVDKGSKGGIEAGMAVMPQKGLIGRVVEVSTASFKIELPSSPSESSSYFPVRVSSANDEAFGLLKDYDGKLHTLVVTQLTGDTDIKKGDVIQASGLGGNSPANLPVGTVIKTRPDSYGLDWEVYVKPYAEMYDVPIVTIVRWLTKDQSMLEKETMKYYLPIVLLSLMLLDGHLARMLGEWSENSCVSNAHFLILTLLCYSMAFEKRYLLITTIVLGAVCDAYYIDVVGIYAVALPLIVWLMYVMKDVIHVNILTEFFSMIIFVTGYELFTMVAQLIFKLTVVNSTYFIIKFLEPTLLLNMIIFVLFIFPFKKLFSDE